MAVSTRALCLLGDQAAVLALVLRAHDGGSASWFVAALFAAGAVPAVVFAPWVGRLVDGTSSHHLLVLAGLAQAGLCIALAWAGSPPLVLGLVGVLGLGQAITAATWQALLPHLVERERLPAAIGLSQSASAVAGVAAPGLAGVLVSTVGTAPVLLLDAATFLALTAAGLLVRTRRVPAPRARDQERPSPREGLAFLAGDGVLRPLVGALVVFVVLGGSVNVVEVFLVRDSYRASSRWYGLLGAVLAAGLVLGSALGGRLRRQRSLVRADLAGMAALATGLAAFALVPDVVLALPAAALAGTGNGLVNVTTGALVMGRAPEPVRGRVAAGLAGTTSAAMLAALALGGLLATTLPPRAVFLLGGGAALLVTLLTAAPVLRAAGSSSYRTSEAGAASEPEPAPA